jgi:hypothetical protein
MRLCSSCREDTNGFAPQRVGHEQKPVVDRADDNIALLAVILPVVLILDSEGVFENRSRSFERNPMLGIILRCLCLVPFEGMAAHGTIVCP